MDVPEAKLPGIAAQQVLPWLEYGDDGSVSLIEKPKDVHRHDDFWLGFWKVEEGSQESFFAVTDLGVVWGESLQAVVQKVRRN